MYVEKRFKIDDPAEAMEEFKKLFAKHICLQHRYLHVDAEDPDYLLLSDNDVFLDLNKGLGFIKKGLKENDLSLEGLHLSRMDRIAAIAAESLIKACLSTKNKPASFPRYFTTEIKQNAEECFSKSLPGYLEKQEERLKYRDPEKREEWIAEKQKRKEEKAKQKEEDRALRKRVCKYDAKIFIMQCLGYSEEEIVKWVKKELDIEDGILSPEASTPLPETIPNPDYPHPAYCSCPAPLSIKEIKEKYAESEPDDMEVCQDDDKEI